MSQLAQSEVKFSSLDLEPALVKGISDASFEFCTPIQAQSLPLALAGRDVEGQAQTGTGKTAAFLVATLNWLLIKPPPHSHEDGQPRALIVAPTRELAVQIYNDAQVLGRHTGLELGVVFGGTGYEQQRQMLTNGVDVLIGTPGRLIDYFKQRVFHLKSIQVAVIDEADRMFDLGFIKDLRYMLRRMPHPEKRLNLLFSATLSFRVTELAYEHMNNPAVVDATPNQVTVDNVTQVLYHVSKEEKIALLLGLLRQRQVTRAIVFANTKRTTESIHDHLEANGFESGMLSGDVPQKKRLRLLDKFVRGELPVLVATDVAARGLHIPAVSHVVNFDLPQDAQDYVHRIGRTARVGASGDAISFACEEWVYSLMDIEEFIGAALPTAPVTEELLAQVVAPRQKPRSARRHRPKRSGSGRAGGSRKRSGKGRRQSGKDA